MAVGSLIQGERSMKFATSFSFAALTFSALLALDVSAALGADIAVKLTGDQEVPPVVSSATGTGTIVIKADKTVSGSIKTNGIAGIMAHVHLAPKNGPPIITLTKTARTLGPFRRRC